MKRFNEFINESDYPYSTDEWEITEYDNDSGKILSVKRTSDGEIFSVGDNVGLKPGNRPMGKIDKFWKSFEQMRVDIGRLGYVLNDLLMKEENLDEALGRSTRKYTGVDPLEEGPTKSNVKKFDPSAKKGPPPAPIPRRIGDKLSERGFVNELRSLCNVYKKDIGIQGLKKGLGKVLTYYEHKKYIKE